MSEKLYTLLLRLYPARFRASYGEDALQLLRDRLRDESGFLPRLRLWMDLLRDLIVSVPREHRAQHPALAPAQVDSGLFRVLEDRPPRPGAFLFGSALALSGVLAFFVMLDHAGVRHASRAADNQPSSASVVSAASTAAGAPSGDAAIVSAASAAGTAVAVPQMEQQSAPLHLSIITPPMDAAERHRIVASVADTLRRDYFNKPLAETTAASLLAAEKDGVDNRIASGSALAVTLTSQMRRATQDMHLAVVYSAKPLLAAPAPPSPAVSARNRQALLDQHCTIEQAELLPHAIGYFKFNGFPDPSICGSEFRSAMASLSASRALIIDLRDNGGGHPAMVALLAGYFFDQPQPWYNPRVPGASSLAAPADGTSFVRTPLYILTSKRTFSAAEHFSYNLKMLHRATLVGEITAGGAHVGTFHRIDDHFGMAVPEFRIVNPYSDRDWESVGVQPDVPIRAVSALAAAQQLAERRLSSRAR